MSRYYETGGDIHGSVCMVSRKYAEAPEQVTRLFDYHNDHGNRSLQWVYRPSDRHSSHRAADDPDTLYSPKLFKYLDEHHDIDFIYLTWRENLDEPDRPRIDDTFATPGGDAPQIIEIIDYVHDNGLEQLRNDLSHRGIPHVGNLAPRTLIAFHHRDADSVDAALFLKSQLQQVGSTLRICDNTPLTAPICTVYYHDIQQIPNDDEYSIRGRRYLVGLASLPKSHEKVAVRPLEDYASAYVSWYFKHEQSRGTELLDDAESLLSAAFSAPEPLREFLGTEPDAAELDTFKQQLARIIDADDVPQHLIGEILKNDPSFASACRKYVYTELDERYAKYEQDKKDHIALTLAGQEQRLHDVKSAIANKEAALASLEQRQAQYRQQVDHAKEQLKSIEQETQQLKEQSEQTLERLSQDAALRLGLKTVVNAVAQPQSQPMNLQTVPTMQAAETTDTQRPLPDALAYNLEMLGVRSMQKRVSLQPFATLLARSRAVTSLFAVDSNIAMQVANAWSFAIGGMPAYRIDASREHTDSISVLAAIEQCPSSIIVLDGVLDTVGEALLFSLTRQDIKKTLIFPVGAYANLSLIAPEVWESMLLVPSEHLVVLPAEPHPLQHCTEGSPVKPPNSAQVISELDDLVGTLANAVPLKSLAHLASLRAATKGLGGAHVWLQYQLAVRTNAAQDAQHAQALCGRLGSVDTVRALLAALDGHHHVR